MANLGSRAVTASAGALTAAAAYVGAVRPWMARWGATEEEANRTLPGDELVPRPRLNWTHAVWVQAAASDVWPWLVQMGQGKGGFYSYDWIENAIGLDIHSADQILPEWQSLKAGDRVPLAPNTPGFPVAILEEDRAMVLHGDTRTEDLGIKTQPGEYFNINWGFYLFDTGAQATRLIERWRADWNPGIKNALFIRAFMEPGAFLMERKMLLGIKDRAERARAG